MASFLYTVNYTWHLYMDLKMKYSQNLHRVPPQVSRTDVQQLLGTEVSPWGLGGAHVTAYLTTITLKALLPHGCVNWH